MNGLIKTAIIKGDIRHAFEALRQQYDRLAQDGSVFVLCSTEYDERGVVRYDCFDVIRQAIAIGYGYVNTIVYPTAERQRVAFSDNVRYAVWLCKDRSAYDFDKDVVRQKHIWKDVEWGKREKNYNAKGKDPGNVWIPTEDDGKAHITDHIVLSDDDVISKLIAMTRARDNCHTVDAPHSAAAQNVRIESQKTSDARFADVFFKTAECMDDIADRSVKTVVTSPPYWDLKDYFKAGQIGREPYETYIRRMQTVWRECFRKLTPDGSLWVNINIRVRQNQVVLIPYDIIQTCKEIGFFYKGIVIWHKSSGIPAGAKNIGDHHEYVLLFAKDAAFAVREDEQRLISDYKNDTINAGAFWNINRKAGSVGKKFMHPAIYPNALAARVIRLSSSVGDVIMDPFLGSGTSLLAAANAERAFVGFEYNDGFKDLMADRFAKELRVPTKVRYFEEPPSVQ